MKRRALSILLTLCITLALFPVPAFAANEEDDTLIELSPPPERSNITQPPLVFNAGDTPPTAAEYNGSYYDQLDATAKAIYDAIYNSPLKNGPSTQKISLRGIPIKDMEHHWDPILAAVWALQYDCPELSWLAYNNGYKITYSPKEQTYAEFYYTEDGYKRATTDVSQVSGADRYHYADTEGSDHAHSGDRQREEEHRRPFRQVRL